MALQRQLQEWLRCSFDLEKQIDIGKKAEGQHRVLGCKWLRHGFETSYVKGYIGIVGIAMAIQLFWSSGIYSENGFQKWL